MMLAEATVLAFTAFSGLRLLSYLPQIHKVARDTNGASAISYSTWALWTGSHLSTGLYAAINLGDRLLAAASALYALCCVVVIAITAIKRHRHALRRGNGMELNTCLHPVSLEVTSRRKARTAGSSHHERHS